MTEARAAGRRQALYVLAVITLISVLNSIGQALWHLVIRDELWGLAVAWKGGGGVGLLWLSYWLWRRAERHRSSAGVDQQTVRAVLDPRRWFRDTSDQGLREWVGGCSAAAVFGVVSMVVLPLADRSPFNALPWTVIWSALGVTAWRERRRRRTAG